MSAETQGIGWMLNGFHAWVVLWVWTIIVLLHVLWRALHGPEEDPIRPSGPVF